MPCTLSCLLAIRKSLANGLSCQVSLVDSLATGVCVEDESWGALLLSDGQFAVVLKMEPELDEIHSFRPCV